MSESSPTASASFTGGGGSSSRRKSTAPQRQPIDIDDECNPQIGIPFYYYFFL